MKFKVVIAAALLVISLVSCQKTQGPVEKKPITLNLWNLSSEQEDEIITRVLDRWNQANPDIRVVRDAVDVESYKLKIKTAIAANEVPDVFMSWGAGFSKPFVDAGKVLPLDGYLSEEIKAAAMGGVFVNSSYDGKVYGLPFSMWAGTLFVNTEMFKALGLALPTTWDELMTAVKAFRASGMGALSVGVAESWTAMFYHNVLALRTAGADGCNAALAREASFDTPEFQLAAEKLKELVDAKAFVDGGMALNYDEMCNLFKLGKVPMMFQGPWYAGMLEADDSPVKGKIKAMHFPAIPGGKGKPTDMLGGTVDIYMVSKNTKYPAEAVKVAEFITRELSKEMFLGGAGLPCYKDPVDTSKIDRLTLEVIELMKSCTGYVLAWDTFLEGNDAQRHLDLVQDIFAGKRSPASFSKEMQLINASK